MIEKLINSIESASEIEYTLNDGLVYNEEDYGILVEDKFYYTLIAYWSDEKILSIENYDLLLLYRNLNQNEQTRFRSYIENKFGVEIKRII